MSTADACALTAIIDAGLGGATWSWALLAALWLGASMRHH